MYTPPHQNLGAEPITSYRDACQCLIKCAVQAAAKDRFQFEKFALDVVEAEVLKELCGVWWRLGREHARSPIDATLNDWTTELEGLRAVLPGLPFFRRVFKLAVSLGKLGTYRHQSR